jgi:hypothetical protein
MTLLRIVARLVPEAQRAEWLREWEAEWRWFRGGRRPTVRRGAGRLASAARHALWLRLDDCDSPCAC